MSLERQDTDSGQLALLTIYSMFTSQDDTERITARCIYGLIFFGVPNRGIRVEHWLPMVNDQPNSELVRNLSPESSYLRDLQRNFDRYFQDPSSKILSIYETMRTKTAKVSLPTY